MIVENGSIQIVVSGVTIVGAIGYLIHSAYIGYNKFKDDVYNTLDRKLDTNRCIEYRQLEKDKVDRIDYDLQQHKEVVK